MGREEPVKGGKGHHSSTFKCVLCPSGLSLTRHPPSLSLPTACPPPGIPKAFPSHPLPVVSSGSGTAATQTSVGTSPGPTMAAHLAQKVPYPAHG